MDRPSIAFLLDEHTPRSIERFLAERGHRVMRAPGGATDNDILAAAERDGLVIVTADRDFKAAITRNPSRGRRRYTQAGLIRIEGEADKAIVRLRLLIDVIERLYLTCQQQEDKRLIVHVRATSVWIDF